MKKQIQNIIQEIEKELQKDMENGTTIPEWYKEIKSLIETAKKALNNGNIEEAFDLVGDINLDLLEQIDEFDGIIGELIYKLHRIKEKYLEDSKAIPQDLQKELERLHKIVDKYI